MTVKKLTHSFSSLKQFDNCPKRYFHQRIEKSVKDEGGEAALYGEVVHKALEERVRDKKPLPPTLAKHEEVCAQLESIPGAEVYAEQELVLTKDFTPTGWWDEDAWIRSKLDVIVIKGNTALIGDYKTGKRRPDAFQLDLFALQAFCHYDYVTHVQASFWWLKDDATDTFKYSRKELPRLKQNMGYKIKRVEDALEHNNWPARPSGLCGYCPCKDFCEYAIKRR
jgi:hypothetical protein